MPRKRRPPSRSRFVVFIRALTILLGTPVIIAIATATRGRPVVGIAIAVAWFGSVLWGVDWRVRLGFEDRKRAPWIAGFAAPMFDAGWSALLLSPATTFVAAFGLAISRFGFGRVNALTLANATQIGAVAGLVMALYGVFIRRRWVRVRRVEIELDDLPKELDGYRIAHLSDLHIGSMARAREATRWVDLTNALDVDLVAVTGDLLSTGAHFHDEAVEVLSKLRGKDGVYACLGNHDYYEENELCRRLGEGGVRVLRNEGFALKRGEGTLFVAGVEDVWRGDTDLVAALRDRGTDPIDTTLLLAHNPDLFPAAAEAGASLTLSGHTHAGQIAVPFFMERLGLGRLTTPFNAGLYALGSAQLFVHAGLGTTGPAIRIGAAPEIVEIVLRRSPG